MSNPAWSESHRLAKSTESRLEASVQRYAMLAQKINADFLCDEENPLIANNYTEEQALGAQIEKDLGELNSFINRMRESLHSSTGNKGNSPSAHQQEAIVKRFSEIHYDYSHEFRNTCATVQRKRESMELFNSSKSLRGEDQDASVAKLLRERSSIAASMRSINEVITQAFEARSSLTAQRNALGGASSGLSGLTANVPTFNSLIDGIQKKKYREAIIVTLFIAFLLCFSIWWVFMK